jgi:hypothetical protein
MKSREFYLKVCNCEFDLISKFLEVLEKENAPYCVIGGIAVNAYCEPIVTLDFDCVIATGKIEKIKKALKSEGFKIKTHPHTWEVTHKDSDIKIQLQRDPVYQGFINRAKLKSVLGYKIKVADKEDVLKGKILAYQDETCDKIKKDKDLLDIKRMVKVFPELENTLPREIKNKMK